MFVFSVPHDASKMEDGFVVDVKERSFGIKKRDVAVYALSADIARLVCGQIVQAPISRAFIDYNRPRHLAFEDIRLASSYDAYHQQIDAQVGVGGFLFDMHGFSSARREGGDVDLILGFNEYEHSAARRVRRGLSALLKQRRYRIADGMRGSTDPIFTAGYTTVRVSQMGLPALQIEISDRFRQKETRELGLRLSRDFADALLMQAYFLKPVTA